jgi:hypothetical protein
MRGVIIGLLLLTFGAQRPVDRPAAPPVMPGCAASDPCNDPSRPWMRGTIEKSCAHDAASLRKLRQLKGAGAIILDCACKHLCDPFDPNAEMTDHRKWDATCQARCNPRNCQCKHPCDS